MDKVKPFSMAVLLCVLVGGIVFLSSVSVTFWSDKPEAIQGVGQLVIQESMTVMEFGHHNSIPRPVLKKVFSLERQDDLQRKLADFGLSSEEIIRTTTKAMALSEEHASKNWVKIPIKFGLWFIFLATVFALMRKTVISPGARKMIYILSILLFGVILGADPSPMGTVKDAIHLYATKQVIFPPRMIALSIFLLIVWLANKFICGWGCQIGTLQDLIFRLNRNKTDTKGMFRQYRLPFRVTNSFRIAVFVLFTLSAFLWATDIVAVIDPFKIYKPAVISGVGWLFIVSLLSASLFVYRPWCHLFCPFGLVGWLVEKISVFKIKVDYTTCIGCEACSHACPSTVMDTILKRDKTIPDCFACGTCMGACPTGSITLASGKRDIPSAEQFPKK